MRLSVIGRLLVERLGAYRHEAPGGPEVVGDLGHLEQVLDAAGRVGQAHYLARFHGQERVLEGDLAPRVVAGLEQARRVGRRLLLGHVLGLADVAPDLSPHGGGRPRALGVVVARGADDALVRVGDDDLHAVRQAEQVLLVLHGREEPAVGALLQLPRHGTRRRHVVGLEVHAAHGVGGGAREVGDVAEVVHTEQLRVLGGHLPLRVVGLLLGDLGLLGRDAVGAVSAGAVGGGVSGDEEPGAPAEIRRVTDGGGPGRDRVGARELHVHEDLQGPVQVGLHGGPVGLDLSLRLGNQVGPETHGLGGLGPEEVGVHVDAQEVAAEGEVAVAGERGTPLDGGGVGPGHLAPGAHTLHRALLGPVGAPHPDEPVGRAERDGPVSHGRAPPRRGTRPSGCSAPRTATPSP